MLFVVTNINSCK